MANVSKNAKTNRQATSKSILLYNGKEVEVVPVKFIGNTAGMRNYIAVQDKSTKAILVDSNNVPLEWNKSNIENRKI